MLGKAFRSSLSPAELDEVISASLMEHPIWGSNGALEDRIYGIPLDEIALSRVYLTKFGDSYTDNALFYMSLVPDGSELTQEMIENNAIACVI